MGTSQRPRTMGFLKFIDYIGVGELASILGVSRDAVYQWRRLETAPKPVIAHKIIKISVKKLDFNDIYMPYVKARLK